MVTANATNALFAEVRRLGVSERMVYVRSNARYDPFHAYNTRIVDNTVDKRNKIRSTTTLTGWHGSYYIKPSARACVYVIINSIDSSSVPLLLLLLLFFIGKVLCYIMLVEGIILMPWIQMICVSLASPFFSLSVCECIYILYYRECMLHIRIELILK